VGFSSCVPDFIEVKEQASQAPQDQTEVVKNVEPENIAVIMCRFVILNQLPRLLSTNITRLDCAIQDLGYQQKIMERQQDWKVAQA